MLTPNVAARNCMQTRMNKKIYKEKGKEGKLEKPGRVIGKAGLKQKKGRSGKFLVFPGLQDKLRRR